MGGTELYQCEKSEKKNHLYIKLEVHMARKTSSNQVAIMVWSRELQECVPLSVLHGNTVCFVLNKATSPSTYSMTATVI